MIDRKSQNTESGVFNPFSPFAPALDYLVDAAQRRTTVDRQAGLPAASRTEERPTK